MIFKGQMATLCWIGIAVASAHAENPPLELSPEHQGAVNRTRRIIYHHDSAANVNWDVKGVGPERIDDVVKYIVSPLDAQPNQIDSVWYDWGEGNQAIWPSKILPVHPNNPYADWRKAGKDLVRLVMEAAQQRGKEVFYSYRINGGDHDFGLKIPLLKKEHPEWTHDAYNGLGYRMKHIFWNFAVPEVRDYKVKIIRELAEDYDFDGISLDFARNPNLFIVGTQWENRDHLTMFMRDVRAMTLEVEKARGRPLLLAARVPENIPGCNFDGIDIQQWTREQLVDILVLGGRSSEVDISEMRRITAGTGIKLYPCFDFVHTSDSYDHPSIEQARGVYANWWYQGADGVYAFNNLYMEPGTAQSVGAPRDKNGWHNQCQLFRELGSPDTLEGKDKVFFIQRRGYMDGHIIPKPEDWWTPRHQFSYINMQAALPTTLSKNNRVDRLLTITVADDVNALGEQVESVTLHLGLHDPAAKDLPETERNEGVSGVRRHRPPPPLYTAKGIEKQVEVRMNNLLLDSARMEEGWLVFPVKPKQLALGDNLVGVRMTERTPPNAPEISIEKLEVRVKYLK